MGKKQEYQYQPVVPGNEYYSLERRSEIREEARKLRRQYLRYKEAEIIYSMSHISTRSVPCSVLKRHSLDRHFASFSYLKPALLL